MAVTTAQFEALKPIPYAKARRKLRTGDIMLFSTKGGFSSVIEHFTDSLWSHSAIIWRAPEIKRILLMESVENVGVRAIALSNRINGSAADPKPYGGQLLVVRHKAFPHPAPAAKVAAMTRFAIDRLGYPYSGEEVAKIGLRIAAGLAGHDLPGELEPHNAYVCSEYVAKCYDAVGIDLAPDKEGFMAPADIADDPEIEAVCAVRPD